MSQPRVLIAGCGYVGSALAARLAADGHRVWGLRRSSTPLPAGVTAHPADLADPTSLGDLPASLDFVFYTAAADRRDDACYRQIYVDGVQNLLQALRRDGQRPVRFFYTSSTAVYGQHHGEWVDERSPTEPNGFNGRRLLEGERIVLEADVPGTVVRLAGIYGPGRVRLVERARTGLPPTADEAASYTNRIHREDAAGALAHLMGRDQPDDLYIGGDAEPATTCEVLNWIRQHLGLSVESSGPPVREADGGRAGKRCRNRRLLAAGYRFEFETFREGYLEALGETAVIVTGGRMAPEVDHVDKMDRPAPAFGVGQPLFPRRGLRHDPGER